MKRKTTALSIMILLTAIFTLTAAAADYVYWPGANSQVFERTTSNELLLKDLDDTVTGHTQFVARVGETNDEGKVITKKDLDAWQAMLIFAEARTLSVRVTYNSSGQVQAIYGPGYDL